MKRWKFRLLVLFAGFSGAFAVPLGDIAHAQETIRPDFQLRARARTPQMSMQETEITPPESLPGVAVPGSVILKPGKTSTVLNALAVKKRYSVAELRSRPVISLGRAQADMRPVFENPDALMNIAGRLRADPELVVVGAEKSEVLEVAEGLIVRQFLSYRVKTGVCSNPAKRAKLVQAGIHCFSRITDQARAAAFADPKSPRYVANQATRASAISASSKNAAAEQAELAVGIAEFRAMLKDPARRAQVEAELGAGETARLETLSDDDLAGEIVNSAETRIEELMFVPARDKLYEAVARQKPSGGGFKVPKIKEHVDVEHSLGEHVFLTGFTIGREDEWRWRKEVTVHYCVVSCSKTYYIELKAGASLGLGLRFPIKTGGVYAYHAVGDAESASVAPVFTPFDGNTGDFAASGLPAEKIFSGRELLAELGAGVGYAYKVPFASDSGWLAGGEIDLAKQLPAPFANGNFRPPVPGEADPPEAEVVFPGPDLLAGLLDYKVLSAKLFPAVKVGLTSDRLRLVLKDNIAGTQTEMDSSGRTYPLQVNPTDHSSSFTIGQPEYNLAFHLTPGLAPTVTIDIAVWSDSWSYPVWFPKLNITLPPDGYTFECHELTVCSYDYLYSPTLAQSKQGPAKKPIDPIEEEVFNWREAYQKKYLGQCPYLPLRFCETAILAQVETTGNIMLNELRALKTFPSPEGTKIVLKREIEADNRGKDIILNSKVSSIDYYGRSLFAAYEPIWSTGCADQQCRDNIHALGAPYVKALKDRQQASPSLDRSEVVFIENQRGDWAGKAEREVEASLARTKFHFTPRERSRTREP